MACHFFGNFIPFTNQNPEEVAYIDNIGKISYLPSLELMESTKVLYEEKPPFNLNPFLESKVRTA